MELAEPLLKALDRMSCGGLVIDSDGSVLGMNGAAERLLQSETALLDGDATSTWSRQALKKLLTRAGSRFRVDHESWITVPREESAPLVLHAIPLGDDVLKGPHTILVMVDLDNRPRPTAVVLQRLFDLTPAEAKLAIELVSGKSLSEVSSETGLTNATLRSQLSSIFNKTQTRRQPELVGLLARVAILP